MPDTSMPPNPLLYSTMMKIITYKSKGSMPKSFVLKEERLPCLNRKPTKREGMHLPQGCARVEEVAMRCSEVEKDASYGNIQ